MHPHVYLFLSRSGIHLVSATTTTSNKMMSHIPIPPPFEYPQPSTTCVFHLRENQHDPSTTDRSSLGYICDQQRSCASPVENQKHNGSPPHPLVFTNFSDRTTDLTEKTSHPQFSPNHLHKGCTRHERNGNGHHRLNTYTHRAIERERDGDRWSSIDVIVSGFLCHWMCDGCNRRCGHDAVCHQH
jgi:hypothetical protein